MAKKVHKSSKPESLSLQQTQLRIADVRRAPKYDPTEGLIDAFSIVPDEYRGNLFSYFNGLPGKYRLHSFLDALSELWLKAEPGSLDSPAVDPGIASAAGCFKDDPNWDEMLEAMRAYRAEIETEELSKNCNNSHSGQIV